MFHAPLTIDMKLKFEKNTCTMTYPRPQMLNQEGNDSGQSHGTSMHAKRKL